MKPLTKYVPLRNGTAFIGMGSNTGLNEGKDYPYYLASDVDPRLAALVEALKDIECDCIELSLEQRLDLAERRTWKAIAVKAKDALAAAEVEL